MNRLFALTVAALLVSNIADAAPKYRTAWYFKASYQSGESYESTDPTEDENLVPWTGSLWTCKRDSVSYNSKKNMVAGFTCIHKRGGFATVLAACPATKEGSDVGNAGIGDESGWFQFTVSCSTSLHGAEGGTKF
jgi:hypothetical protein